MDAEYGAYLGNACKEFIAKHNLRGVIVHRLAWSYYLSISLKKGLPIRLGNGNAIHAASGLPVVNDFRSLDVRLGGQGAPLVPAGDKILFTERDVCLNLGGIANLSVDVQKKRRAFDVCFVNMGLNYLAGKVGKSYDKDGDLCE